MPIPAEYQRIHDHLYQFLLDTRELAGLGSTHQAYTMIQGVFQTFRRRLKLHDSILFSNILPAGIRALFVAEWDPDEPQLEFGHRSIMLSEVKSLRSDHNFSTDTAIRDVARALRKIVDLHLFEAVMLKLPAGAIEFWDPDFPD